MPNPPKIAYLPRIDGLRALAILAVVGFHAQIPGFGGGFIGVDVFFVLSGYLITRLLLAEHGASGRIDLARFWGRRLRRLYPAMLCMVVAFVALSPWMFPKLTIRQTWTEAWLAGLYISDLAPWLDQQVMILRHMWTLALEERFYLVWPVLLIGLMRLGRVSVVWTMGVLFLVMTGWRLYLADGSNAEFFRIYNQFDTHSTGLVLGCWLGAWNPSLEKHTRSFGLFGLLGLGILTFKLSFYAIEPLLWGFTAAEAFAACLIVGAPAWMGWQPLAWLGRMSYGWYLWHYPVFLWMRHEQWNPWITLVVGGVISLGLAVISYYTVEARFRHKRKPAMAAGLPE